MFKKAFLILLVSILSTSIVRADTEHTLGVIGSFFKGVAYLGTFFSWLFLYEMFTRKKKKYIFPIVLIAIVCGLIGIGSIDSGEGLLGYSQHEEIAQSYIAWGWFIIIVNILPVIIAVFKRYSKDKEHLNSDLQTKK